MKQLRFLFILLITFIIAESAAANDIDNLKTIDDVQKFLVEKVNKEWTNITFIHADPTDSSTYGKGKFFKLDLDNNGLTDLVVNGDYFMAVTDLGKDKYEAHFIDRGAFQLDKYTLDTIIYKDKTPLLLISSYDERKKNLPKNTALIPSRFDAGTDTLIFFNGDFAEYNPHPDNLSIQKISFTTSGCFGTCPIFELTLHSDRTATYDAKEYNDKKGKFKSVIDSSAYNQLVQTINYIHLSSLKDNYSVGWTDDQTVTLEIEYKNGRKKKISDYGAIGTFGLENVYNQLFALRETQKWK